jgi:hypothetical protein
VFAPQIVVKVVTRVPCAEQTDDPTRACAGYVSEVAERRMPPYLWLTMDIVKVSQL